MGRIASTRANVKRTTGLPNSYFPLSGFRLYDDLVIVESIVGEQQLAEADDVARYEKYLELLRDAASTALEAAAVIRRSLESL
jgi:hypothetical protein